MLTVSEFARKLGISRQRVHQYINAKRVKPAPVKLGNQYIIQGTARIIMGKM